MHAIAERLHDLMVDSDPTGGNRKALYETVKEWRHKYPRSYRDAVPMLRDILDVIVDDGDQIFGDETSSGEDLNTCPANKVIGTHVRAPLDNTCVHCGVAL